MNKTVIGIDLGTTNTCVACYRNGGVKILENEEGDRITPSFIFVTEKNQVAVGKYAKSLAESKPEYGICEIKRLIGRKFDDPHVQKNKKYFPFVVAKKNNEPSVEINRKNNQFTASPIKLCSTILKKIKTDAEAKVGSKVDKAVITVPAYFNMSQREATLTAAAQAGFTVLKLLNEPTAAALTYYLQSDDEESCSLVYDLGGGTFDVAILKRQGNNVEIVGVDGDTHLGGNDFDNLIVEYFCDYLQKNHNYNPKSDHRTMRRIYNKCEESKKILSVINETTLQFSDLVKESVTVELTRDQFEKMADQLFKQTIKIMDNCIKACNMKKTDIQEVILSGGSTRIPKIQTLISDFFGGKKLNKLVNPDECVAEGAAIQAAMLSTNPKQKIEAFQITDVTPLSLGVSNFVDLMTFFIERNTPLPVSKTLTRITVENQQRSMRFEVYEGERKNAKKNRHLGTVAIHDITPAPPGQCEATFTMSIDENGILKVTAKEKLRDNVKDLTIVYTRGHRSDKEVKNALTDAEQNRAQDERFVKFASIKEYVLDYCERLKYNLETKKMEESHKHLIDSCLNTKILADGMEMEDEKELTALRDRLKKECDDVVEKYNFELMPVHRK